MYGGVFGAGPEGILQILRAQVDPTRDAHASCGGELLGLLREGEGCPLSVTVLAPGALGSGQLRVCGLGADGRGWQLDDGKAESFS